MEQPDAPGAIGERNRMWRGVAGVECIEGKGRRRFARAELLSDDGELDVALERFAATLVIHEATPWTHPKMSSNPPDPHPDVRPPSYSALSAESGSTREAVR